MRLARNYRFGIKNETGVSINAGDITINGRRFRFASDGRLEWEATEGAIFSNVAALATATFLGEDPVDNSTDDWIGGEFEFRVVTTGTPSGDVILYYQTSTDGGITWPDDERGIRLAVINFTAAATKIEPFSIS